MDWIPLHVHSQYSILDSTCSIPKLVKRAKEYQMTSLALTDHGNLFGAVDFYKACTAQKIKPIIGCEVWVAPTSCQEKKKLPGCPAGYPLVLLAKNYEGYQNLCKLSSIGYLEGFYYYPRIDEELLQKHHKGLICLSGNSSSLIATLIAQEKEDELVKAIEWHQNLFGEDYYFEIVRHSMENGQIQQDGMGREDWLIQTLKEYTQRQELIISQLSNYSKKYGIELAATNDTHYIDREDYKAHEVLINVSSGESTLIWERDSMGNPTFKVPNPKRKIYPSHSYDFKSPEEMKELFADYPESISSTLKIAEKCELELDFKTKHYPVYYPPHLDKAIPKADREKETANYLFKLAEESIPKRYPKSALDKVQEKYPDKDPLDVVRDRLKYEFEIISSKGMCDYLLIVYDFIAWAKSHAIAVGPGRGSAAGSIIAYLIGITDIEPLRFHLFFERFINPERISYPDIDVDICMDRRQEVIDYMIQKYGRDRVAQIITFGTMKAKMAIKDVGRVLSVPLAKVNQIAKLVPEDPNMTLEKALEIDPELRALYAEDKDAKEIIDMAKKTEGSIRNTSIHAAGLIVSEDPITEHVPVCTAKDADMTVTQYAMKPVESVGMLKIDFLGLKTLTSLQKAVEFVKERFNQVIDWANLPLDDTATFELLNQGKTLGVFQLESGGMQDLARQLHIDSFEEIIAVGALYRPGPMDMIPSFINRKHGREKIEIEHPLIKDILSETYGIMVYQEQVMQIASVLAGYTLGEGDVLRRAMGKKDHAEMKRQRDKFIAGAKEKEISEEIATTIFDKIEKFASYGFNKSHAAAYAYLSYATAYLKANYPAEWMAALMTCDRDDLSKVAKFIREAKSMHIAILPPDVNEAKEHFFPTKEGIRFAMSGIKGVGTSVVEAILEERNNKGPFASLYDCIRRVDKKRVGKKNLELMVAAGCFDFTGWTRDQMKLSVAPMYDEALQQEKDDSQGVMNLFSLIEENKDPFKEPPKVDKPMEVLDVLQLEKELLGFYLTGHPMDSFQEILDKVSTTSLKDIEQVKEDLISAGFIIETVQVKIASKSKRKFAILTISDGYERFELPIWPEMYENNANLIQEGKVLFGVLQVDRSDGGIKLSCRYISELQAIDESKEQEIKELLQSLKRRKKSRTNEEKQEVKKPKTLQIHIDASQIKHSHILHLKKLIAKNPGPSPIEILFQIEGKKQASLSIDGANGANMESSFAMEVKELPFVTRLESIESV